MAVCRLVPSGSPCATSQCSTAKDGIWYRRERERWLQADPPRRLVCASCGHHNLGRHSYCVECGQRLNR